MLHSILTSDCLKCECSHSNAAMLAWLSVTDADATRHYTESCHLAALAALALCFFAGGSCGSAASRLPLAALAEAAAEESAALPTLSTSAASLSSLARVSVLPSASIVLTTACARRTKAVSKESPALQRSSELRKQHTDSQAGRNVKAKLWRYGYLKRRAMIPTGDKGPCACNIMESGWAPRSVTTRTVLGTETSRSPGGPTMHLTPPPPRSHAARICLETTGLIIRAGTHGTLS